MDPLTLLTLAQFYDPQMRCFTFPYFHIAPTLEEFEHLAGIPMKNKLSFMGMENSLEHEVIIVALHIQKKDVTSNLEVKGNTKGLTLKFLIEKTFTFMDAQSWKAFYVVIALSIYRIVLFPNLDDFIDMATISNSSRRIQFLPCWLMCIITSI